MKPKDTYSFVFTDPGIYPYFCRFHTDQKDTVVVTQSDGSLPPTPVATANVAPTPFPLPANAQALARDLINPRGIAIGPDGALYVAETGTPPEHPSAVAPPPVGAPSPGAATSGGVKTICEGDAPDYDKYKAGCPGVSPPAVNQNGRISRIAPDGTRTTVAGNLPVVVSIFNDMIGPNAVAFVGNDLYVAIAAGETRGQPDYPTGIYKVTDGKISLFANLDQFQKDNPPKFIPADYNYSLPYDMVEMNGKLYITDGNASVVFEVKPVAPEGQRIRRIWDMSPDHPMLTGITVGGDGALYVTNFTKAPYPAGTAQVWRLTPDGQATELATGLSLATGLVRAPDGTLYASEFGKSPDAAQPGRIVRLTSDGTWEQVAGSLTYPTDLAWGPDGLYVSNASAETVDPSKPVGMLLRIDPNRPS